MLLLFLLTEPAILALFIIESFAGGAATPGHTNLARSLNVYYR